MVEQNEHDCQIIIKINTGIPKQTNKIPHKNANKAKYPIVIENIISETYILIKFQS